MSVEDYQRKEAYDGKLRAASYDHPSPTDQRMGETGAQTASSISRRMTVREQLLRRAAQLHAEAEQLEALTRFLPDIVDENLAGRAIEALLRKSI